MQKHNEIRMSVASQLSFPSVFTTASPLYEDLSWPPLRGSPRSSSHRRRVVFHSTTIVLISFVRLEAKEHLNCLYSQHHPTSSSHSTLGSIMSRVLFSCLALILAAAYMGASMIFSCPAGPKISREGAVHTTSTTQLALDLHFCRSSPSYPSPRNLTYYCIGPEYDNFTIQMHEYANAQHLSTWGRREFPLPANASVLFVGNSHTWQMCESLRCQYWKQVRSSTQRSDLLVKTKGVPNTWTFKNNATAMVLANSPYMYHKTRWVESLNTILGRPLSSFDAIVMGRFNPYSSTARSDKEFLRFSLAHPEFFDSNFTTPTIERLAEAYAGPIIALPMFAVYGQDVKVDAQHTREVWNNNRSNIYIVETRKHIDAIGHECGSNSLHASGTCQHTSHVKGSEPNQMHRCTGKYFLRMLRSLSQSL